MSDGPTVRILGAGFSRSLGGPLLNELLSVANRGRLCAHGAIEDDNAAFNQVYALYHHGSAFPEGYLIEPGLPQVRGARLWSLHPRQTRGASEETALL